MKSFRTSNISGFLRSMLSFSVLWLLLPFQAESACDSTTEDSSGKNDFISYTIDHPVQQPSSGNQCDEKSTSSNPVCDFQPVPSPDCLVHDTGVIGSENETAIFPSVSGTFSFHQNSDKSDRGGIKTHAFEFYPASHHSIQSFSLRAPPAG